MLARFSSTLPPTAATLVRRTTLQKLPSCTRFNSSAAAQADSDSPAAPPPKKRGIPLAQNLGDISISKARVQGGQNDRRGGSRREYGNSGQQQRRQAGNGEQRRQGGNNGQQRQGGNNGQQRQGGNGGQHRPGGNGGQQQRRQGGNGEQQRYAGNRTQQQRQDNGSRGDRQARSPRTEHSGERTDERQALPVEGEQSKQAAQSGQTESAPQPRQEGRERRAVSSKSKTERLHITPAKVELGNLDELFGSPARAAEFSQKTISISSPNVSPSQARVQLLLERTAGDYSRYVPRPFPTTDITKLGVLKLGELVLSRKRDAGLRSRQHALAVVEKFVGPGSEVQTPPS